MKRLFPLILVLAVLSCSRPSSTEQFLRGEGPFAFAVDMSDSTATYGFDVYTRIDAREYPAELQLDMAWKAPSDSIYRETVYLPVNGRSTTFTHDAYAPYRDGVVPVEWGVWELVITVPDQPDGFRGMGLVVRRTPMSF